MKTELEPARTMPNSTPERHHLSKNDQAFDPTDVAGWAA
jgi:hypothetical protein